jgi:hypothetical protein
LENNAKNVPFYSWNEMKIVYFQQQL